MKEPYYVYSTIEDTFANKKAVPATLVFAQTATTKLYEEKPVPTLINTLTYADFKQEDSGMEVCGGLNFALHDIL